jgi:hypothetical protein
MGAFEYNFADPGGRSMRQARVVLGPLIAEASDGASPDAWRRVRY